MVTAKEEPIKTVELARDDNFDPRLYVIVNPDLMAECKKDKNFDLHTHFRQFGKLENRKQLCPEIFHAMKEKFERFKGALNIADYRYVSQSASFPVAPSSQVLTLDNYDSESSHPSPNYWTEEISAHPNKLYLDIGAGFRDEVYRNCAYLEVYPSLTADIIMVPNSPLPFKDASLDGVGCFSVMEHTEDPHFLASEIKRVIRPGGKLFIDWPFLQPFHGYPSHYFNATEVGLRQTFSDAFEVERLEAMEWQRADSTLSWILNLFINGFDNEIERDNFVRLSVGDLVRNLPKSDFYKKILDKMSDDSKRRLACGNTLIGRRKS